MIISDQLGDPMKKRTRPTFSPEFRLEASQLVVDQNYIVRAAAQAMNVGISTMAKWVAQLKLERQGKTQPCLLYRGQFYLTTTDITTLGLQRALGNSAKFTIQVTIGDFLRRW